VVVWYIADNLSKAGWSWGCVSTINSSGKTIFIADAHRDNGRRFIVHADEKLTAFLNWKGRFVSTYLANNTIHNRSDGCKR